MFLHMGVHWYRSCFSDYRQFTELGCQYQAALFVFAKGSQDVEGYIWRSKVIHRGEEREQYDIRKIYAKTKSVSTPVEPPRNELLRGILRLHAECKPLNPHILLS